MKYYYILHKITKVPGGGNSIIYASDITLTKVSFTNMEADAKKMRFLHAVIYSFIYNLSTMQRSYANTDELAENKD